jgi:serine/threonine protein kinase
VVVGYVVRAVLVADASTLAGLRREIELLERLNHPIVVRSFGGEAEGARPHVVLEHLEGPRLSSLQRKHGRLLMEQLVALAIEISSALHYLAGEGLVHLDVKPSNIIMGGPPRLIDLSIARTREQCATLRSPVGTDAYMAPEQAVPSGQLGPPADVWGLGATLHEAVTGERPFPKGTRDSRVSEERFPQLVEEPRELPAHVPAALADSIVACLEPDPGARPTPAELGDRLQVVLEHLPRPRLSSLKPRRR